MVKNKFKEIHIWDFPDDIYILLDEDYTKSLFKESLYRIAKRLNRSRSTVLGWYRCSWRDKSQYMPIWALKKLHELYKINKALTEQHVVSYRIAAGKPITNPILPIIGDSYIFRIIGHLIGDGSGGDEKGSTPNYCNTSLPVRMEFIELLKNTFGEVHYNHMPKHHALTFSKAIVLIIKKQYKINDFRGSKCVLLDDFLEQDKSLLMAFVKSFIIDESTIRSSGIDIYCGNYQVLTVLKKVCLKLGYRVGKIKRGNEVFYFRIYSYSLIQLKNDIGIMSHKQKEERLLFSISLLERGWKQRKRWVVRSQIIKLLKEKPMTVYEICFKLGIGFTSIRDFHLIRMEKEGLVCRDTSSKEHIWRIKEAY